MDAILAEKYRFESFLEHLSKKKKIFSIKFSLITQMTSEECRFVVDISYIPINHYLKWSY